MRSARYPLCRDRCGVRCTSEGHEAYRLQMVAVNGDNLMNPARGRPWTRKGGGLDNAH